MTPHILIAEDQRIFHRFYRMALGSMSCELHFVLDGWEALEFLKKNDVHLILLDIDMPKMNGTKFMRYFSLTQAYQTVPVAFVSSQSREQIDAIDQLALKMAAGYLQKPFKVKQLRTLVDRLASSRTTALEVS